MVIGFDGSRIFPSTSSLRGDSVEPGQVNRTGTENYSYQLLRALAKTSAENIYMVYVRSGAIINRNEWPSNFKFITINLPILWTQVGLAWRTLIDPIDLLFVPAHTLPLIRKPGLKTVMTVHDLGAEYLPSMHQLKQRLYLDFITKYQLKGATKLIAVSEATKKDLIKKAYIDPKKIEVIYEGVDREVFKPVKGLSRAKPRQRRAKSRDDILVNSLRYFGLKPQGYFLFVGTIQPRKNLARLIEAYSLFLQSLVSARQSNSPPSTSSGPVQSASRSSELVRFGASRLAQTETGLRSDFAPSLLLVGSKGWLSEEIYDLPKKLGIEDRVKFLGSVPERDLPALYSGALALVFPSLFEGFGLPILEAMACGCPVITSATSSMPEVAGEAAILVNPENIEEIAAAMKNLAASDILRDILIQKGFTQVEKFSWEKCAKEILELFNKLKN